ncbi:hypothetical protein [Gordonia aichiensis]|uniref:hypothetical protein n=1 Tax=Gordonia aichiensis TaxID=36820 RepID=UPI003266014A
MGTATITIWHNEETDSEGRHPAWERGYRATDRLVRVMEDFELTVRDSAGVVEIAEGCFQGASREFGVIPEWTHPVAEHYVREQLRSLSKGDVVVVDGEAVSCDSVGWIPVSTPTA